MTAAEPEPQQVAADRGHRHSNALNGQHGLDVPIDHFQCRAISRSGSRPLSGPWSRGGGGGRTSADPRSRDAIGRD